MQLKEKLMNQTRKNGKKTNFGSDFGLFWSKFGPKMFFREFNFYLMLYIFASYHCMQFQRRPIKQTWKNDRKPSFRINLAQIFPALPKKFFWSFASAKYYALLQAIIVCNFKENYRTKLEKMTKNKKLVL